MEAGISIEVEVPPRPVPQHGGAAMKISVGISFMLVGLAVFGTGESAAQADSSDVKLYDLGPKSSFETGCFGPCECPIFLRQLQGTFYLQRVGFDPLFTYYKVSNVQWTVPAATSNLSIRGSGTYKVGGEFAVQQQLSLDLSVNGGAAQRFDSGLVPGGGEFPRIVVDVSLHQNTACIDTVMHVDATDPVATSVDTGSDPSRVPWARVAPNPFRDQTSVRLMLSRPGALDVMIYDVRGRAVRHLVKKEWVPTGPRAVSWDGRRDQGSACPAGVYFLGARVGTERAMNRIVKLE